MDIDSSRMRVILLGAPASGKSTIAKEIIGIIRDCSYFYLDKFVIDLLAKRKTLNVSDEIIDEAVKNLLKASRQQKSALVELPHHNYQSLISRKILELQEFDHVILLIVNESNLIQRNSERDAPIPSNYVHRCASSIEAFKDSFGYTGHQSYLTLNTGLLDIKSACLEIIKFINLEDTGSYDYTN
jgi:adenylate kinase family enzyme